MVSGVQQNDSFIVHGGTTLIGGHYPRSRGPIIMSCFGPHFLVIAGFVKFYFEQTRKFIH